MNTQLVATWNVSNPAEPAIMENGRPESPLANQVLCDYLRLGPGRTFPTLLERYRQLDPAPTHSLGTLHNWSQRYSWAERVARYDTLENERLQAEEQTRRAAILHRGLALEYERIDQLTSLFQKIKTIATDEEAFWITDIKFVRQPDGSQERVETRRFNGALVRSLRGLLDDIASETGGRPLRLPVRSAPDEPAEPAYKPEDFSFDVFTPEECDEFIRLETKFLSQAPAGRK